MAVRMSFVAFTRPDNSPVVVDSRKVMHFAPVPSDGPLKEGTRIVFDNSTHQDVKEKVDEVTKRLTQAPGAAVA
jgi:hypothetical protein